MMTYCNYKNLGDQFEMFTNIEPLCCVTGTIRVSEVNYTSKTKKQTNKLRTIKFTICMETQKSPNGQNNPGEKRQSWRNWFPNIRQYYKATVIKTVW